MTLELVSKHGLLDVVMGKLWSFCDSGRVDSHRRITRTLVDIQMIMEHKATVIPYLLRERRDVFHSMVNAFAKIQGMNPYQRQTGNHVERENTDWINCVMLESDMFLNMFDQFFGGVVAQNALGLADPATAKNVWLMASEALSRTAAWSVAKAEEIKAAHGGDQGRPESVFARLLRGEEVSVNLPLHRMCARMLQYHAHPCHVTDTDKEEDKGEACMANLLAIVSANKEDIKALIGPVLKAQAFMMQVGLGLWVRNGEEVLKLQKTYSTAMWFWHEISWELDNFLLKVWIPAVEHPNYALGTLIDCFGGNFLMGVGGLDNVGDAETERVPLISEMLFELGKVLLDRSLVRSLDESVRRNLMHWLFVDERQTHSKLIRLLSLTHRNYKGIDRILDEIAVYHEPKLQEGGKYTLREECWKEFDCFFALYTKADLQKALENAEICKIWRPEMQFVSLRTRQGDPLRFVFQVLDTNLFYQLIWAALLVCLRKPSGYAESAINIVLHLVFHAMDQTERGTIGQHIRTDFAPSTAGFASNSMKACLAYCPDGNQPSILAMIGHVCGEAKHLPKAGGSEETRDLFREPFGASESLRACARYILDELKAKGLVDENGGTGGGDGTQAEGMEVEGERADPEEALRKKRQDHQAAVMANFMAQQQAAAAAFLDDFTDSDSDMEEDSAETDASMDPLDSKSASPAIDKGKGACAVSDEEGNAECALCKGEVSDATSLCWVGHCQVGAFPSRGLKPNSEWEAVISNHEEGAKSLSETMADAAARDRADYAPTNCIYDASYGLTFTTCGHKMHHSCYVKYFDNLRERSSLGSRYEGMSILSIEDNEFLCPVCRRLSNVCIPCTAHVPASAPAPESFRVSLENTLSRCGSAFENFGKKVDPSKAWETGVGAGLMGNRILHRKFLYSNLVHVIGYNCCHLEVQLRREKAAWVNVEAARCAIKGQSKCIAELANSASLLLRTDPEAYREDRKALEEGVRRVRMIISGSIDQGPNLMEVEGGGAAGEGEEGNGEGAGRGSAFPLVRPFQSGILSRSVCGDRGVRPFYSANLRTKRTIHEAPLAWLSASAPPGVPPDALDSLCDPFKVFLESCLVDGGPTRGHLDSALELAALQGGAFFVVDTYCAAVSEHLSLIDAEGVREERVDSGDLDQVYREAEEILGAIVTEGTFGAKLRERLVECVARCVAPCARRCELFRKCLDGTLPAYEDLAGGEVLGLGWESWKSDVSDRILGAALPGLGRAKGFLRRLCPNVIPQVRSVCLLARTTQQRPAFASVFSSLNYQAMALAPLMTAPSLIPLPHLYQNLLLQWLDKKCLKCAKVPKEPALCLVCGHLLCCAETCCKDGATTRGECTQHAMVCGARTGVFLLLRQTCVLILNNAHACIYSSPYLDSHGEEDPSLRRGKPLFLDESRYRALNLLWAADAFDYDSKVLKLSHGGTRRAYAAEFY